MITIEEILNNRILALSVKEPYGTLMLNGKEIETRTWETKYRGLVLICASKKGYTPKIVYTISNERQCHIIDSIMSSKYNCNWDTFAGKAFSIGRLDACYPMRLMDEDKAFVEYYPDLYSWFFKDVTPIQPFPWKGSLGFREVNFQESCKIKLL